MPDELTVDLELECTRAEGQLRGLTHAYVPLAVAAAITFHQAQGNTRAIVSRTDYDDALNIAAAALSRLIPIYTMHDALEGRVEVPVDLVRQRFARGATRLRNTDGSAPLGELSVRRGDMLSAILLIRRSGVPFSFAFASPLSPSPAKKPVEPE